MHEEPFFCGLDRPVRPDDGLRVSDGLLLAALDLHDVAAAHTEDLAGRVLPTVQGVGADERVRKVVFAEQASASGRLAFPDLSFLPRGDRNRDVVEVEPLEEVSGGRSARRGRSPAG